MGMHTYKHDTLTPYTNMHRDLAGYGSISVISVPGRLKQKGDVLKASLVYMLETLFHEKKGGGEDVVSQSQMIYISQEIYVCVYNYICYI